MGENTEAFLTRVFALLLDNYPGDVSDAINNLRVDGDLERQDLQRIQELFSDTVGAAELNLEYED